MPNNILNFLRDPQAQSEMRNALVDGLIVAWLPERLAPQLIWQQR